MGIGSVGSPSGRETNLERTSSDEGVADKKSLGDSAQNIRTPPISLSGADGGSRGYGSASLAEVLIRQAQLEVPAACVSQGVIEHLRNSDLQQQVTSPRLNPTLPQNAVGTTEVPTVMTRSRVMKKLGWGDNRNIQELHQRLLKEVFLDDRQAPKKMQLQNKALSPSARNHLVNNQIR